MHNILFFVWGLLSAMRRKYYFSAIFTATIVAAFLLTGAVRAGAQEMPLPDRFGLRLGGYAVKNFNSIMRLDSTNSPIGTYIDFNKTLGGETQSTVFRLDGFYRFNEHHALTFSWYDIKLTGSRVLDTEFIWDGQTYPINARVDSKHELNVYKLSYQYSVYHSEEVELGAAFGLHVTSTYISLSRSGIGQADNTSITAPLPVFGLFADYKFTPRFSVYYNYQLFFINYQDKFKGGLQDFLLGLEYRVFRQVGLGAAYNRFSANMTLKGNEKTFYHDTSWNGVMLYAAVYF